MTEFLKIIFNRSDQPISDEELVKGCIKQERKFQNMLYKKYSGKMMGVCLGYTKDKDTAKDLLQDAFIKVFTKIQHYTNEGSLEGWVRRVVVNTAIDYYRKSSKLYVSNTKNEFIPTVDNYILEQLNSEDLIKLIRKLPDGYRLVFNLNVIEGYTHEEIAKQLGITESTSRSQLTRARKLLQEWVLKMSDFKSNNSQSNAG